MRKFNIFTLLLISMFVVSAYAENGFLTVDELVDSGYELLSGQQIIEIMSSHTIRVVDIETEAVSISKNDSLNDAIDRKFVEKKGDKASSQLDVRLMARAPALEGDIERRVIEDELVVTDGVRTYRFKLYRKQEETYAVRDIDHGNVFFKVESK